MGVWIFNGISTYIGIFSLGFNSEETIIYKAMLSFNKECVCLIPQIVWKSLS